MKSHTLYSRNINCCLVAFIGLFFGVLPVLSMADGLELDVNVGQKMDAGIGFGHLTDATIFDLTVNLQTTNPMEISESRVFDQGGRIIFLPSERSTQGTEHTYEAAGVKANYGHSAKFEGDLIIDTGLLGGGIGLPDFQAKLSDTNLAVDSLNVGNPATNRAPSGSDAEDSAEYVTGDSAPDTPMGCRAANNEVIAVKAALRKKKDGTFTVTAPDVTFYVDAASAAAGGAQNVIDWSDTGAEGKTGYMKVTADKTITATFTPSATGGREGVNGDSTGKAEDMVKVILNQSSATFSPNPVVTGYSLPAANSTLKETVVVTLSEAADAEDVEFRVKSGTENRIKTINVVNRDTGTGKVTIEVAGNVATPVSAPYGDTTLEAYKGENVLGEVQVIVAIPVAIGYPHDAPKGSANGLNMTINNLPNLPEGHVALATKYWHDCTIQVNDQFGNALANLYAQQAVEEYLGSWKQIAQMSNGGVYTDPVGQIRLKLEQDSVTGAWGVCIVPQGGEDHTTWLQSPPGAPLKNEQFVNNISVRVAGFELSPGITGRVVTCVYPATINITWP